MILEGASHPRSIALEGEVRAVFRDMTKAGRLLAIRQAAKPGDALTFRAILHAPGLLTGLSDGDLYTGPRYRPGQRRSRVRRAVPRPADGNPPPEGGRCQLHHGFAPPRLARLAPVGQCAGDEGRRARQAGGCRMSIVVGSKARAGAVWSAAMPATGQGPTAPRLEGNITPSTLRHRNGPAKPKAPPSRVLEEAQDRAEALLSEAAAGPADAGGASTAR